MTQPTGIEIEVPAPTSIVLHVPGPQGPAGLQNVIVSSVEPPLEERFVNLIWIDTS